MVSFYFGLASDRGERKQFRECEVTSLNDCAAPEMETRSFVTAHSSGFAAMR
jgi:hypothetical protein